MKWQSIETAPKDGSPFWMATHTGGVMLEAWHYCFGVGFIGVCSRKSLDELKALDKTLKYVWASIEAPQPNEVK